MITWIDLLVVVVGWLVGNMLFHRFEEHLHWSRRAAKFAITVAVFALVGWMGGPWLFYGLLALMTVGQVYLHAVYFPRHGVNGFTAEPHDRYLALIAKMKQNKEKQQ